MARKPTDPDAGQPPDGYERHKEAARVRQAEQSRSGRDYVVRGHYRDEASGEYGVLYSREDGYATLWGRLVSSWLGAIGKDASGEDVMRFVRIDGEEEA